MEGLKAINLFGTELKFSDTTTISSNETISSLVDKKVLVNTANITLTLQYANNKNGVVITVYAFANCTIRYYINDSTPSYLNMAAGTTASFIYFNGWKYNGIYGAMWN